MKLIKSIKSLKTMKSSQANKKKLTKSCAHRADFFRHLFSIIVIEGTRTKLVIFFNCVLKRN